MRLLKYLLVFLASIVGIALGQIYGPINQIPSVSVVNDEYFNITRNHFLVLGLLSSIFACIAGVLLRVSFVAITTILAITGTIFVTLSQSSDPGFLSYLLSATVEFLIPFMGVGIIVIGAFMVATTWWRHRDAA